MSSAKENKIPCPYCGKKFTQTCSMRAHCRKFHAHMPEPPKAKTLDPADLIIKRKRSQKKYTESEQGRKLNRYLRAKSKVVSNFNANKLSSFPKLTNELLCGWKNLLKFIESVQKAESIRGDAVCSLYR